MIHIICLSCLSFLINTIGLLFIEKRFRTLQIKAQAAEAKAFSELNKIFLKNQYNPNRSSSEEKQSSRCKYFRDKAINIRRYLINSTKFFVKDGRTIKKPYNTLSMLDRILEE